MRPERCHGLLDDEAAIQHESSRERRSIPPVRSRPSHQDCSSSAMISLEFGPVRQRVDVIGHTVTRSEDIPHGLMRR